jgi:hypothetical protein
VTIKRRPPQPKRIKFPPAHLYLEDLEEIIAILKPESESEPPTLAFVVDDEDCDSVEDLRTIGARKVGGRAARFKMTVYWKNDYDRLEITSRERADLSPSGSTQRQTWVRTQVHGVFTRRMRTLWKLRWLVVLGGIAAYLVVYFSLDRLLHRLPEFKVSTEYHLLFAFSFGIFLVYPLLRLIENLIQSTIILENYQRQGNWLRRHRDQIILVAVTALISATTSAVITTLVHKWLADK